VTKMEQRNLACKTCGTKVFKTPGEVDDHHKQAHPDVPSQPGESHVEVSQDKENQEASE